MRAQFKMKKGSVKLFGADLVNLAKTLANGQYPYFRAPYSMSESEFLAHYSKIYFILPSVPTRDDLETGIYSPTGARLVSVFFN